MGRQRTTAVLNKRLNDVQMLDVVDFILDEYEALGLISWEVRDDLPEGIGVDVYDQLEATKRDAGEDACYLIVWMVNSE